jgi:hypothetical protein
LPGAVAMTARVGGARSVALVVAVAVAVVVVRERAAAVAVELTVAVAVVVEVAVMGGVPFGPIVPPKSPASN